HLGNYTGDFSAGSKDRIGEDPHQADTAAAIHQSPSAANDLVPQFAGAACIGRIGSVIGAAEDTDPPDSMSSSSVRHGARIGWRPGLDKRGRGAGKFNSTRSPEAVSEVLGEHAVTAR